MSRAGTKKGMWSSRSIDRQVRNPLNSGEKNNPEKVNKGVQYDNQ
jgi:hypothetical protein